MKSKIINIVKYNKIIYNLYFSIFSMLINVIKLFVKPDKNLILFNSFAGRKFDDSPKELFEAIKNDSRFSHYKLVWAFHNPRNFNVEGATKIKTDGLEYFITALKARVWITNSSVERGLNFKGKNTIYLNTWHGTPLKKMGSDIDSINQSFSTKADNKFDLFNVQSEYETDIFSRAFNVPKSNFLKFGLPRNDVFANHDELMRNAIREKLGLPNEKKIILYAPTFREYEKDSMNGCLLAPPIDMNKWRNELSNDYILLIRAHYEVANSMEIIDDSFVRNVTNYPSLNELMIASDLLVSDYSSIFFDYSIMDKPMFHFSYDYQRYKDLRGMYFDIRDYINGGNSEETIINLIKNIDYCSEIKHTKEFRARFVNYYGNATMSTIDYLDSVLR